MHQISEIEFNRHGIMREKSGLEKMGFPKPTEERAWYAHRNLLGIVLFDKVDSDWSFVALLKESNGFHAYDVGASFPTAEAAEVALRETLEAGPEPL
jgi:hypothetical protein